MFDFSIEVCCRHNVSVDVLSVGTFSGPEKIVCTFEEEGACEFGDDLTLKERWIITESKVTYWDNTLNNGAY